MYGATSSSSSSSVHYSRLDDDDEDILSENCQIKFCEKTKFSDTEFKIYENFVGSDEKSTSSPTTRLLNHNQEWQTSKKLPSPKEQDRLPEFESQKRNSKMAARLLNTRHFFKLYKFRSYLAFLENILPGMDDSKENLSKFCNQFETHLLSDQNSKKEQNFEFENLTEFSTQIEATVSKFLSDCVSFVEFKTEMTRSLSRLDFELSAMEKLFKRVFIRQYADAEYLQMENFISKLYHQNSNGVPNFDKCLFFILDCGEKNLADKKEFYLQSMALTALYKIMERRGDFSKFNSEIIRLAYNVKKFEETVQSENYTDDNDHYFSKNLRQLFLIGVQTIIWHNFENGSGVLISQKCLIENDQNVDNNDESKFLQASNEFEGYIRLTHQRGEEGDQNFWTFLPIKEGRGHYFFIVNKKCNTFLTLKRDGPEYRRVYHRPIQIGYFNQHWKILTSTTKGKFIFKNRAHHQLTLASNGESNVLARSDVHCQFKWFFVSNVKRF